MYISVVHKSVVGAGASQRVALVPGYCVSSAAVPLLSPTAMADVSTQPPCPIAAAGVPGGRGVGVARMV